MRSASFSPIGVFEHALVVLLAKLAEAPTHHGIELLRRLGGHDRDRAGGTIPAEQGALRSLEDFDALDVVEGEHRRAGARRVNAIDVHADRGIGADTEVTRLDAADLVTRLRRAVARHHQARHEAVQITHVFRGDVLDQGAIHDLDGERHVLQRLRAQLRGHSDLFHFLRCGVLRDG